ncbi:hypothetical protein MTsPCn9_10640 [Croceitalea sp. MTPC9]|uniref:lantibiotic dehydratase n=1 Tax=unclassified Croceitalea TaxID=2632280 RepID=UPI002B3F124F|nr:hypothetical protein MTsPCn6_26600 [Croceitalea sp. MTPC6]GMN16128.1 hypothetical protein MTsPCn9_10640 [Croceitalea sp. MTPC9]
MDPKDKALFTKYIIDDTFVVRTPYLPLERLGPIQEWGPPQTAIPKWWSNSVFKRAVQEAAPDFSQEIQRWLEQINPKKTEQIWYSLLKYRIRICTRATPFGRFAGPALGSFGKTTKLVRESSHQFDKNIWVDLHDVSDTSNRPDPSGKETQWFPNTTLYPTKLGQRYWDFPLPESDSRPILQEVSKSPALCAILKQATNGAVGARLLDTLTQMGHSGQLAEAYLQQLKERQILVPDTVPSIFEPKIQSIENTAIKHSVSAVNSYPRFLVTTLDSSIKEQLQRALHMSGLFSPKETNTDYSEFSKAFASLFGNRKIRLVDVMDGEYGLGYPLGRYREANSYLRHFGLSSKQSFAQETPTPAQQWLWDKFTANPNVETLYLDSNELMAFDTPTFGFRQTFFGLVAWQSWRGKSLCHPISFGGASAAVLHARHALGHPGFLEWASKIATKEKPIDGNTMAMEVAYRPLGKEMVVTARPQLRDTILHLNNGRRAKESKIIALESLLLHHNGKRLVITHRESGKQVEPYLTTAYDHQRCPLAIYRFLGDHQFLGQRAYAYFDWGPLPKGNLKLPRVIIQDILLSKRTWQFSTETVRQLQQTAHDSKRFVDHWKDFCLTHQLPKKITWSQHDQTLVLDIDNLRFVRLFLNRLPTNKTLALEEYLPPGRPLVKDGRDHTYASEFQFSFFKTSNNGS